MIEIDEDYVKKVLGEHHILLKCLHERILSMYDELADSDELVKSVSIKRIEWGRTRESQTGTKKDLADAMLLHQRLARERGAQLRAEMYRLVEEEESINRIWVCFHALRDREYAYLTQLYVQNQPYKRVEAESGVSHRTFEMARKRGLKAILCLYRAELDNVQIIRK